METGRIIKIISNQYTIQTPQRTVIAIPRGKLRREEKPVVGDIADFEEVEGSFRLDKVHPRKNRMVRPSVANVDQALIVQSLKDPDFSSHLLNRLMFLADLAGITPAICLTKSDALEPEEFAKLKEIISWYEKAGYDVVYTHPGSDNDALRKLLEGKVTVLCGQTGAGKSSLLNRLDPTFQLHTQEISKALGRGRHTTRHCELHPVADGLVADTPGFSSLDFTRLDVEHLDQKIRDFQPYLGQCRFADCRHLKEPGCAIKDAVEKHELSPFIYEDYRQIMEEYLNAKKRY